MESTRCSLEATTWSILLCRGGGLRSGKDWALPAESSGKNRSTSSTHTTPRTTDAVRDLLRNIGNSPLPACMALARVRNRCVLSRLGSFQGSTCSLPSATLNLPFPSCLSPSLSLSVSFTLTILFWLASLQIGNQAASFSSSNEVCESAAAATSCTRMHAALLAMAVVLGRSEFSQFGHMTERQCILWMNSFMH